MKVFVCKVYDIVHVELLTNCTCCSIYNGLLVDSRKGDEQYIPLAYSQTIIQFIQHFLDCFYQYILFTQSSWSLPAWLHIIVCDIINNGATAELFYDAKAQVAGDPYYERKTNQLLWVDRKDRFVNFLNVETKENRFDEHVSRLPVYYVKGGIATY